MMPYSRFVEGTVYRVPNLTTRPTSARRRKSREANAQGYSQNSSRQLKAVQREPGMGWSERQVGSHRPSIEAAAGDLTSSPSRRSRGAESYAREKVFSSVGLLTPWRTTVSPDRAHLTLAS